MNSNASNGSSSGLYPSVDKIKQTQAQVDEVHQIVRTNVEKLIERDGKLSDLDQRATALETGATQFSQSSRKLRRKYWWQNTKMNLIIGGVALTILIIILVLIFRQ